MYFRRWFKKKRFDAERRTMEKKGTWGDNADTLEFLLDRLQGESFDKITVQDLERAKLQVFDPNVDLLVQRLQRATHLITERVGFGDQERQTLHTVDLDRYFITTKNFTIAPPDAMDKLTVEARRFLLAFQLAVAELDGTDQESKVVYYRRMTVNTVADVRIVLETISTIVGLD